jgi:hypothetical protein
MQRYYLILDNTKQIIYFNRIIIAIVLALLGRINVPTTFGRIPYGMRPL